MESEIPSDKKTESTADRWIRALKNNRIVAVIVVAAVIITGIGAVTEAIKHVKEAIVPPHESPSKSEPESASRAATEIRCGRLGKVSSESSAPSEDTTLTFINDSGQPVNISWIDENGALPLKPNTTTPKDMEWTTPTSKAHVWVIATNAGKCLGIVSAGEAASIVKITNAGLKIRLAPVFPPIQAVPDPPQGLHRRENPHLFTVRSGSHASRRRRTSDQFGRWG